MSDVSGADVLAGPRGRRMCWVAVDEQSFERTGRYQLRGVDHDAPEELILSALTRVLADTDLSRFSSWDDEVALLHLVAESVCSARYWQDPDELDRALADERLTVALGPVAEALGSSSAADWWSTGAALDAQVIVDWREGAAPRPRLSGTGVVLAEWKKETVADEVSLRDEHVSSAWWSPPIWRLTVVEMKRWGTDRPELSKTTRSLPGLGAVGLELEEDSFGLRHAFCWPVRCRQTPNVFEIRDADDWRSLVERFPIEVTYGRRGNWKAATGLDVRWMLPDWSQVAEEYDAVHVTVKAYLETSGRPVQLDHEVATLLAGWNPDETYWLTDALVLAADPTGWTRDDYGRISKWCPERPNGLDRSRG
jgi:hypothetical protein